MANLVIDIGNTFIKIAVFEQDKILFLEQLKYADNQIIDQLINKYKVEKAIISSVLNQKNDWETHLKDKTTLFYFSRDFSAGVSNHYLTPETLGLDRLAAVFGAKYLYPETSALIIDGGTCITYDWVDASGNYYGGSISPGLLMRFKALNNYTAVLPLLNADIDFDEPAGNNTHTAIISGVQNGIKYELEGFINSYRSKDQDMNIILSGGDSIFFDRLLKNSIFAPCIKKEPNLVLIGLNAAILNYND